VTGNQESKRLDVKLYRVDLRQLQVFPMKLEGPASSAMALGPSGTFAITPKPGAPVWLFDLRSGRLLRRLEQPSPSADSAQAAHGSACVRFDASGTLLAVAGYQQPARWFDVRTGKLVSSTDDYAHYDESSFFGCTLSFTPDHQLVVQGDGAGGLAAWDLLSSAKRYDLGFAERSPPTQKGNTGQEQAVALGDRETYTEAVVSPAADHAVIFRHPNLPRQQPQSTCTLVDLQTGASVKLAIGLGPAAFSQDGRLLVAGGIIWDIEHQRTVAEIKTYKSGCSPSPEPTAG
jgi:WD40 repeat protein